MFRYGFFMIPHLRTHLSGAQLVYCFDSLVRFVKEIMMITSHAAASSVLKEKHCSAFVEITVREVLLPKTLIDILIFSW